MIKSIFLFVFLTVILGSTLFLPCVKATEIFSDGFESGDFSAWTGTDGSVSVVGSPVHCGDYAYEVNANYEYIHKSFSAESTINARWYMRWTAPPTTGNTYTWGWLGTAVLGSRILAGLYNDGGTVKWRLGAYTNAATFEYVYFDTPSPQVDTWYCIEIAWQASTLEGASLYVDGNLLGSITGTTAADSLSYFTLGTYSNLPSGGAGYYDCVVVADAYIGCEAAGESYSFDLSETCNISSNLNTQKSLNRANTETLIIEESSIFRKAIYKVNSETSQVTVTIETQKSIAVLMLVDISEIVNLSGLLETVKHIHATLIELPEIVYISAVLDFVLPIIPLTTDDLIGLIIVFFVIAIAIAVAALTFALRKK
jgi:hypothetical protein